MGKQGRPKKEPLSVDFTVVAGGAQSAKAKLDQIVAERAEDYGDFELNVAAFTRVIEAMLTQNLQMRVKLPDSFSARIMASAKMLRQCHKHKQDNIDDRINYEQLADKMDAERRIAQCL